MKEEKQLRDKMWQQVTNITSTQNQSLNVPLIIPSDYLLDEDFDINDPVFAELTQVRPFSSVCIVILLIC
jgi:hypothetical protein